ncbi:MAG: ABC transporter permease [Clostridiales Family XIII bacterium]|nr:ABC transporter permease [Clostridiales Family XIII bacterium]
MKLLGVLWADARIVLIRFPLIFAALFVCLGSVLVALPPQLTQGGNLPKVSLAVVYDGADEMADMFFSLISDLDVVDSFYDANAAKAEELLQDGDVDVVIALPEEVIDALIRGEPAVISVRAVDPLIGHFAFQITSEAVKALNRIQNTTLTFRSIVKPYMPNRGALQNAEITFDLKLIQEALVRDNNVKVISGAPEYHLQVVALTLFLIISIVSVFVAALTSRQFSFGYLRRLALHGISGLHVFLVKALMTVFLSVVLCLLCLPVFSFFDISVQISHWILSVILLNVVLFSVCMAFASVKGQASAASARTMLGAAAILLFLLFAGGGFYPVYLMPAAVRWFNPAWLAHLLSEWTIAGTAVPISSLLLYAIPVLVCAGIALLRWRTAR